MADAVMWMTAQGLAQRRQIMVWAAERGCSARRLGGGRRAACLRRACSSRRRWGAAAAQAPAPRRGASNRPAGAALRQPEGRSGQPAPGPRQRVSRRLGVATHRPAGRGDQGVRAWRQVRDAEGTTGWVWTAALSGRRTAIILPWEVKKGRSEPVRRCATTTATAPRPSPTSKPACSPISSTATEVVPHLGRHLSRLHRADQAVGRLPGRGHQVAAPLAHARRYLLTSRTTTSMCAILMSAGGSGRPSTRIELPGMSTSLPSRSMKKWL